MEQKYSLDEIIFEAMKRFEIPDEYEDEKRGKAPGRFRKKFENYVKTQTDKTGKTLWESAEDHEYEKADKKSFHFFTKKVMEEIIYSDEIYDYLIARSNSERIKKLPTRKFLNDLAEKEKKNWEDAQKQAGFLPEQYFGEIPTPQTIMEEKNTIMFTALFELFFNPIDEKLLNDDIFNSYYYGGNTATAATMDSKLRHADLHNYFTPRKKVNETLDVILDALADKIVDKMKLSRHK